MGGMSLDVDAFMTTQVGAGKFKIFQPFFFSISVGGVSCLGSATANPVETTLFSTQLPATQGLLVTSMLLRVYENTGSEFLSFGYKTDGQFIQDYQDIAGAIINCTDPFDVSVFFKPGVLAQLTCKNYSGTGLVVAGNPVNKTDVTLLGYFAGYRYQTQSPADKVAPAVGMPVSAPLAQPKLTFAELVEQAVAPLETISR